MERFEDDTKLSQELRALRPRPRDGFAAELDERAAAGFPRRGRLGSVAAASARVWARLRAMPPRRVVLVAGAASLTVIAATAALTLSGDNGSTERVSGGHLLSLSDGGQSGEAADEPPDGGAPLSDRAISPTGGGGARYIPAAPGSSATAAGGRASNRVVKRWSKIFIGAPAADVPAVASEVFAVTDANNGIVVSSTVREGDEAGENRADANFQLLIPSGKVGEAMESFSSLGEVISRRDSTADITAGAVRARTRVKDSRARIESLLGQLAAAATEPEREAVEAELRGERRRLNRLSGRLDRLRERAQLSRVDVRIVGDGAASSSSWGVADGLDEAGHLLAVAAGVAIVAIAVLGPLALIALLVWLARRTWLTWSRRRALG